MTLKSHFKTFFSLFAISYLLLAIYPVHAALVPNCRGTSCTPCHLFQLIANIVNFIVKDITPPLAGLFFLVGGVMMVAAGGSEERFKMGKTILVNALIGTVIVLAAWVIINTLITTLAVPANGYNPVNWWRGMSC